MAKQIIFSEEARRSLKAGIDIVAKSVVTTLGPKGRNIAIDRKFGSPTITHDGVTVAKEIELEDPFENMGAQLLKEAATKTNDIAGDGTTTSTVLAHSIVTDGLKNLAAGANPMLLKRGIEAASKAVAEAIGSQSIAITSPEEIANVASISAQDREIGELIAEVMDKVGNDGVITVEESRGLELKPTMLTVCSLIVDTSRPISLRTPRQWNPKLRTPMSLFTTRKSLLPATSCLCLKNWCRLASASF